MDNWSNTICWIYGAVSIYRKQVIWVVGVIKKLENVGCSMGVNTTVVVEKNHDESNRYQVTHTFDSDDVTECEYAPNLEITERD